MAKRNFKLVVGFGCALLAGFVGLSTSAVVGQDVKKDPANAPFVPGFVISADQTIENLTPPIFHRAARNGDLEKVKSAIKIGIDVNAKSDYGATALFFACDRGQAEVVDYLLKNGADPNVKDSFYNSTATSWSLMKGNQQIILNLLSHGGKEVDLALFGAIGSGDVDYVGKILALEKADEKTLVKARDSIKALEDEAKRKQLLALFEPMGLPETKRFEVSAETLAGYVGVFANEQVTAEVSIVDDVPLIGFNGGETTELLALSKTEFSVGNGELRFESENGQVNTLICEFGGPIFVLTRKTEASTVAADKPPRPRKESIAEADSQPPKFGESSEKSRAADLGISSPNWPGFRGNGSRGVADGQSPPTEFNVGGSDEKNLLWKTPLPGLGLSCPVIWDDHIFVTTAIAEGDDDELKIGLYGDVESVEDDKEYEFKLICLSKSDGSVVWERTANKAKPAVKRHAKSSHANPTVATDGEHVVAFFGSEGLYCFTNNGDLKWKLDFGFLDSGWFYDPDYQWGFASSPVIFEGRVIVQCDVQGQSFLCSIDVETGKEVWRTDREEIPTWSSPIVHQFDDVAMVITNGTKAARAYDVEDGSLLWTLSGNSEIVVPTPNVAHGLIFVSSGYAPIRPIYAIKPDARGDISLPEDSSTNESIPWSEKRGGPYMPSPIVYGDYLYCCANNGVLTCYVATTGELVYKERMSADGGSLSFTASPIASDGYLYFTVEDGRVLVVKAGSEYELVSVGELGESILATPAISQGAMYFRTQDSLIAVGKK